MCSSDLTPLRNSKNLQIKSSNSVEDVNSATPLRNSKSTDLHFTLSWSHYLKLMRIENPDERKFYEIEATENNWSLRVTFIEALVIRIGIPVSVVVNECFEPAVIFSVVVTSTETVTTDQQRQTRL